jgi:hypothetical protein
MTERAVAMWFLETKFGSRVRPIPLEKSGAGEGIRTPDPNLGKVVPQVCGCLLGFAGHYSSSD